MKNYLEYKGYVGIINISAEDRVFFGTIHGINDLVTFEAKENISLNQYVERALKEYSDETLNRANQVSQLTGSLGNSTLITPPIFCLGNNE
ncbi:hypothetical protein [Anaerovorax odorimutans]|uniref:hypothetical protein n=1 Tax=Anaerovorax odorimutans TaxID=109327 RepID=UPI000405E50D|nr:hypothetical protein [Anaerovorax odorimutans]